MEIEFKKSLFNKSFWHLKEAFEDEDIRFIWFYGGSSSSKTFSVVQLLSIAMLSNSDENTLILRKYATDIRDSIYSDFKNIISGWGLSHLFVFQQNYILCTATGSFCRFRGLDDSEKVKGISTFKRVVMEEVSQFDEVDFKQLKKRLRGRSGQQIIGIFNPISEEHWIKQNIFDKDEFIDVDCGDDLAQKQVNKSGNTVILRTNYLYNAYIVGMWKDGVQVGGFVDKHVIEDFERDKISDYNYYLIYGLGHWGKIRTGGEFWKDFDTNKHVRKVAWNESLPIHLSWDENVNPYLSCCVYQIEGKQITMIDEICLADPRNRVADICREFIKRYPQDRVKGLFVYGDRTSVKEDTKLEKGENFFTKIVQQLKDYRPQLRLQSVNPSIVQSGGFINEIYRTNFENISIFVGDNCKKAIFDFQYSLEDSDGTIKKTKKTNPVTKVSYEEFGHISDLHRYILTVAFANEYQLYLRGGKASKVTIGKSYSKSGY